MSKRRLDDDAMRLCVSSEFSHFRQKLLAKKHPKLLPTHRWLQVVFQMVFRFPVVFKVVWKNETTS